MFKKLALTFGTSVITMIINIIGGIITARLLGPLGKGQLTAVVLWPGVFASVGSLGLVNSIVYFSGKDNRQETKLISAGSFATGLLQTLLFSLLGYFLIPILMRQYGQDLILISRVYLLFIPLNIFTQYGIALLQGKLHITAYNIVRFLVPGSYLLIIIILAALGKISVFSCAAALLCSNAITLIYELYYLRKVNWLGHRVHLPLVRRMLSYGIKAHIGNISALLNIRLDQMVMAVILPARLLGLYAVAVTISSGVTLITDAIATISFPTIASQVALEDKRMAFSRSLRLSLWCSLVVIGVMLLVSAPIIILLFGADFSGALPAARVLIISAGVLGMNSILASGLKGFGKPGISSVGELISLASTGIMLWLLLPRLGIMGAAIASLIAYSCNFIFMFGYIKIACSINAKDAFLLQAEDYARIRAWLISQNFKRTSKPDGLLD